jgi:hypothetical protein
MFTKKGKVFPVDAHAGNPALSYTAAIRAALREELGDSHRGVKVVMKWTGASERSAKNWLSGARGRRGSWLGIRRYAARSRARDANV